MKFSTRNHISRSAALTEEVLFRQHHLVLLEVLCDPRHVLAVRRLRVYAQRLQEQALWQQRDVVGVPLDVRLAEAVHERRGVIRGGK